MHIIAQELQDLKQRVVELRKRCPVDPLGSPSSVPWPIDPRQQAASFFVDPCCDLVGLDAPTEEVANMVMDAGDKQAELKIVSIVGMPGSGKTTLANAVYRRLITEQSCFKCRAFVYVGLNLDLRKTLMDMLSDLGNRHQVHEDTLPINLIARIRDILDKERYLILVDDLWGMEHWEKLKGCFPENSLGSRIITTTRNVALATKCGDFIYDIQLLSEIDSRKLFLNIAFGTGHGCPQGLEDLFAQITSRCGGLPLALVTLASVLRDRSSMGEWERLVGSIWLSSSHPYAERMKQMLNLSYKVLPPYLRKCLLYLSIFPEYTVVKVERLLMLWIAEGFIAEYRGLSAEETAKNYLTELIGRNIVQPLHHKHYEFPRYCSVHPVIHDFVVCKSMEEKFATMVNVQNQEYFQYNYGAVRRLSLQSNINGDQAIAQNDSTDLSRVRSIAVFGHGIATPHLTRLKVVRVLDLEGCDGPVCLDGLSKLIHLRYLSLRGTDVSELPATIGELRCLQILGVRSTKVKVLPPSIRELRSLQNLDVRSTKVKELPPSIRELLHLRYLNLRDTDVSELPVTIGELRCLETLDARSTMVKVLPPSIMNLKHTLKALLVSSEGTVNLVETATRIPEDIQHCQRLEKLGIIDLREHHASFVKALGGLNSLRVLEITWSSQQSTERAYREALVSSMENWSQLKSLTIHCGLGSSMEFLGSLRNPPQRLKKFKVTVGRFAVLPQWMKGLEFLSFMQITVCKLSSDDLKILRNLPNLECLILGLEFIPRAAIVIENDGFSELTRFSLDCPVPWLNFSTGAMPKLTYLELKFCSGPACQESVPSGIGNLRSLTEVVLCYNEEWCANSSSVKMTVEAVKKEVAKHHNPINLIINGTTVNVNGVRETPEATEICSEAKCEGEAKDDVEVVGERTRRITSEIEEIEDDTDTMKKI